MIAHIGVIGNVQRVLRVECAPIGAMNARGRGGCRAGREAGGMPRVSAFEAEGVRPKCGRDPDGAAQRRYKCDGGETERTR